MTFAFTLHVTLPRLLRYSHMFLCCWGCFHLSCKQRWRYCAVYFWCVLQPLQSFWSLFIDVWIWDFFNRVCHVNTAELEACSSPLFYISLSPAWSHWISGYYFIVVRSVLVALHPFITPLALIWPERRQTAVMCVML